MCVTLLYTSCTELEPVVVNDSALVLESEMSPTSQVRVDLRTTQIQNIGVEYPKDADIFLSGTGLGNSELGFSYDESKGNYFLRSSSFRVEEGGEYQIRANVPNSTYKTLLAETTVPHKVNVKNVKIINQQVQTSGHYKSYTYEAEIELNENNDNRFYHIIPSYSINDASTHSPTGIPKIFQVRDVLDNVTAVYALYNEDGLLIDSEKLSSNTFRIKVSTLDPINTLTQEVGNLNIELRGVNESYYKYYEKKSQQSEVDNSPFGTPVPVFTNIENGLGFFGAYTTTSKSFPLD